MFSFKDIEGSLTILNIFYCKGSLIRVPLNSYRTANFRHSPPRPVQMCYSSTSSSKITFWVSINLLSLFEVLLGTLKSSAFEYIMRMTLVSGTTDLLRTCYFPISCNTVTASLWNVFFISSDFFLGWNDSEEFALLEFGLKGVGCRSRGMRIIYFSGERIPGRWERREFLTAFLQHALECTRLYAEIIEEFEHDLSAAPEKLPCTWAACSNTLQCSSAVDQRNGRTLGFLKWVNDDEQ